MTRTNDLNRDDALPLWAQLLSHLRTRIATGEFSERFPTDYQLVEEYGVSRHTVREALRRIQAEGLLERRRGRGSQIKNGFEQPLGTIYSLYRSIEAAGVEQTSVVLTQEARRDREVADRLDLPQDCEFFFLERLRLAGEHVLALDRVWLPLDIAEPLLEADFSKTAVYNELRDRCSVMPESGTEMIRSVMPTAAERDQLGLSEHDPAFLISRQTKAGGRPLEWRVTLARADLYQFVIEWSPSGSTVPDVRLDD